jgi:two-component system osmolarity sensor histidine kinase EnvZ
MFFDWLKHYMPRSLYARTALILIFPVVALQVIVSVVFIQRHLENVTRQMSVTMIRELRLITEIAQGARDLQELERRAEPVTAPLQISVSSVAVSDVPESDLFSWEDYSGRVVAAAFRASLPEMLAVEFPEDKRVRLFVSSHLGPLELVFDRRRVTVTAPHQLIVTMVFFGLLMTVIASLYMRNQLRPIKRLASAAQAFGRGRTEPYRPSGAIEVRAAGNAFLDMRARIERQIEQRTMMLSGVSHDLRTPLTRLKLGLAMIDEDDAEPLLHDVDEMQRLIDAFLDFSRGAGHGDAELTNPATLLSSIVGDAMREGKQVVLGEVRGEGELKLRQTAIRRAVENLIGNAVRYGTQAQVSCVLSDKSLRIRVEDDGPGIPVEQRGDAVRPFTRLDPARNQNQGSGVGLGLAIVADIARAHGGTLRLGASEALGGLQADIVIAR